MSKLFELKVTNIKPKRGLPCGISLPGSENSSCGKKPERLPSWFKVKFNNESVDELSDMMADLGLNTVCKEANCPNMAECFKQRTATFMILGSICTRKCPFCNVRSGSPETVDKDEPSNLAEAVRRLNLKHVVITQVTRDDLSDGGAQQFADTIREIRKLGIGTTIEVLISDLKGDKASLDIVIDAQPDVINHNLETVPNLYPKVRPMAQYQRSLDVLKYSKSRAPHILTKTGIMLGLGETIEEIHSLMDDCLMHDIDILTLGQYLRPSSKNIEMERFITPDEFEQHRITAMEKGFSYCASSPLVRSSYKAWEALDPKTSKPIRLKNSLGTDMPTKKEKDCTADITDTTDATGQGVKGIVQICSI